MALPYVTGPAHTFLGVGTNNSPLYLGTSEGEPEIVLHPHFEPVMNDLAGPSEPFAFQFMGEGATIHMTINRYNEATLALAQARPFKASARGTEPDGSNGALMYEESLAFSIWLLFPYATKTVFRANNMPAGYRFPVCFLEGPDRMPVGTRARKISCNFRAQRLCAIGNGGVTFTLYDHNMAAVANAAIN